VGAAFQDDLHTVQGDHTEVWVARKGREGTPEGRTARAAHREIQENANAFRDGGAHRRDAGRADADADAPGAVRRSRSKDRNTPVVSAMLACASRGARSTRPKTQTRRPGGWEMHGDRAQTPPAGFREAATFFVAAPGRAFADTTIAGFQTRHCRETVTVTRPDAVATLPRKATARHAPPRFSPIPRPTRDSPCTAQQRCCTRPSKRCHPTHPSRPNHRPSGGRTRTRRGPNRDAKRSSRHWAVVSWTMQTMLRREPRRFGRSEKERTKSKRNFRETLSVFPPACRDRTLGH
jgi:hypothetical protein